MHLECGRCAHHIGQVWFCEAEMTDKDWLTIVRIGMSVFAKHVMLSLACFFHISSLPSGKNSPWANMPPFDNRTGLYIISD